MDTVGGPASPGPASAVSRQGNTFLQVFAADTVITGEEVLRPGWVAVDGPVIAQVGAGRGPGAVTELGPVVLTPGFVDLHCHGGGGAAFTDGPGAIETVIATHRRHGTTSLVASLVTDTLDVLGRQLRELAPFVRRGALLGTHLEGPWLSERYPGAHAPQLLRDPAREDVAALLDAAEGTVVMVTLAVERRGGTAAVEALTDAGVIAALGHSDATYAQAMAAIDAGARGATHLFNAERPVHHREPGLVVALLEREEVFVELIADGVHLHPAMLRRVAAAARDRVVLVTDAMAAAGAGEGRFAVGPLSVEVRDGVARVAGSTTIAGSTLTLDRAIRYAVQQAGVPLPDAVRAATATPADVLGRQDIGRLRAGAAADLVVLTGDLRPAAVLHRGQWVDGVGSTVDRPRTGVTAVHAGEARADA